ncbi:amino acid transporter [Zhengella mangrovi]|uniref:Amino acid transporter n=1 Tax=Zhengella mangrovi TaxID=1982044 RepID=A0A2G1QSY1_9HYPH|nr:LysE family transporter [Zhengella mangrovi]PHP68318.1 amino acid transporter [Zhengella mangrovi]
MTHGLLILLAWMVAAGSPGPATLAISSTAMAHGRRAGLLIAAGIAAGSATWGLASALGVGAVLMTKPWLFEVVRYLGAGYLLFLAAKSLRNALRPSSMAAVPVRRTKLFAKGYLLHLTNPKAVIAWGSIYAIALPADAGPTALLQQFAVLFGGTLLVFFGYAMLFATPAIATGYRRLRRWFDAAFGLLFGAASLKILTARLGA